MPAPVALTYDSFNVHNSVNRVARAVCGQRVAKQRVRRDEVPPVARKSQSCAACPLLGGQPLQCDRHRVLIEVASDSIADVYVRAHGQTRFSPLPFTTNSRRRAPSGDFTVCALRAARTLITFRMALS